MTDPLDDPLADLSAALDVDPSPEFAARVRTKIAGDARGHHWQWTLGGLATVTVVMLAVWLRQPQVTDTRDAPQLVVSADGTAELRLEGPSVRLMRPEPVAPLDPGVNSDRPSVGNTVSRPEPETLIAPDQAIAFQRLVKLVYEGRVVASNSDWQKTSSLEPVASPAEVTVAPVEVQPVVVDPLIIDTMSNQEG